jgi:hypothetical protein
MQECTPSTKRKLLKEKILLYRKIGEFHQLTNAAQSSCNVAGTDEALAFRREVCSLKTMLVDFQ